MIIVNIFIRCFLSVFHFVFPPFDYNYIIFITNLQVHFYTVNAGFF
nr:MAG TPA: hypothetical protein [Caudoviricetes sp.]